MGSITQVELKSNEELIVKTKNGGYRPTFWVIGKGTVSMKPKLKSIDLLEEVARMDSDEKYCFFQIRNRITYWDPDEKDFEYAVRIRWSDFSKSHRTIFSRGYKKLSEKGLVKRIKRATYMINPLALVPKNFNKWWRVWEEK